MNASARAKLGLLEDAWHHRRTGLLVLRSRRGGLARVAINDGGLCRNKDSERLARAVLRHDVRFHEGPIDRPGDQAALGRAVLAAWRAVVAVSPARLDDEMMISLAVAPDRVLDVISNDLFDRLTDRQCSVGALLRGGDTTMVDLRAMVGMGVLTSAEAQAVRVSMPPTASLAIPATPPERLARPPLPAAAPTRPAAVQIVSRLRMDAATMPPASNPAPPNLAAAGPAAATPAASVAASRRSMGPTYVPHEDTDARPVVDLGGPRARVPRQEPSRMTEEPTLGFRPVSSVGAMHEDDTEQIRGPDEAWAEPLSHDTLAVARVAASVVPEELTGDITPTDDALTMEGFASQMRCDLMNKAREQLREGHWEEAEEMLTRAEALGADDPLILVHRAWADLWLRQEASHVAALVHEAVNRAPTDPVVTGLAQAVHAHLDQQRIAEQACQQDGARAGVTPRHSSVG